MLKGRKRYTKKNVIQTAIPTFFLMILVCVTAYFIQNTKWLNPKINEITASYISLNNNDATDMIKITNLQKMSDKNGKSEKNKSRKEFEITGEKEVSYQIVLYHVGNSVEDEYIHYSLTNEKETQIEGKLSEKEETYDGGKILFEGTIEDGKNWNLKMWVDKEYERDVSNVSYEIRIKVR